MATQEQQLHTVDTFWDLVFAPENDDKRFHLIDGEIYVFLRARYALQGRLVASLLRYVYEHVEQNDLGLTTLGVGHYSAEDIHTVLGPAIAFLGKARMPQPLPDEWIPVMPDLAVEIAAPGETLGHLRQKAVAYLSLAEARASSGSSCRLKGASMSAGQRAARASTSNSSALMACYPAKKRCPVLSWNSVDFFPLPSNMVLKGESPPRPYKLSLFNPIPQPLRVSNR